MSNGGIFMESEIVRELCEDLKWYERIVVKIFKTLFISTYKIGVKKGFKWGNF